MPSGREIHTPLVYSPPSLEAETLAKMRAPVDREAERAQAEEGDDSSDDEGQSGLPGAFPGSSSTGATSYY